MINFILKNKNWSTPVSKQKIKNKIFSSILYICLLNWFTSKF